MEWYRFLASLQACVLSPGSSRRATDAGGQQLHRDLLASKSDRFKVARDDEIIHSQCHLSRPAVSQPICIRHKQTAGMLGADSLRQEIGMDAVKTQSLWEQQVLVTSQHQRWRVRGHTLKQKAEMRSRTSKQEACNFCRSNREPDWFCRSHRLRDSAGRLACPVLRGHTCETCGATGDLAHTRSYCSALTSTGSSSSPRSMKTLLATPTMSSGKKRKSSPK